MLCQTGHQVRVVGRIGVEFNTTAQRAGDFTSLDGHILDLITFNLCHKIREGELLLRPLSVRALKQIEKSNHEQANNHPQRQVSAKIIQEPSPSGPSQNAVIHKRCGSSGYGAITTGLNMVIQTP